MNSEASKAEQGEWQALAVVDLLGQLDSERDPLSAEEENALLAWNERPHCRMLQLSATDATAHIPRCERHPARVHYERLSRIARRIDGVERAGALARADVQH